MDAVDEGLDDGVVGGVGVVGQREPALPLAVVRAEPGLGNWKVIIALDLLLVISMIDSIKCVVTWDAK